MPPGISGHLSLGVGLVLWRQDMGLAGLFQLPADCPAVAAHITCNADLGIAEVAYHPLWLERSQSQASMQPQM